MVETDTKDTFGRLVGRSPGMQSVYEMIEKSARVNVPVLVVGETGTGKELVAQEIHDRSERCEGQFVPVNMGSLPEQLISSELFGHVKGAFTGASNAKEGRFAEATEGTLFLDEIGTMDEIAQVSLLRVLESRRFRKVGGKMDQETNVRIIAATNEDPIDLIEKGHFRQDLFQRLQVLRIDLPPLRKRRGDIRILAEFFLQKVRDEFHLTTSGFLPKTLEVLNHYEWSGNVRELKNSVAQSAVMAGVGPIEPQHLPTRILDSPSVQELSEEILHKLEQAPTSCSSQTGDIETIDLKGMFLPLGMSLEEVEKLFILKTLEKCENNKSKAARELGISRKALYDKLTIWEV